MIAMSKCLSTDQIRLHLATRRVVNDAWPRWAATLLRDGADTPSLRVLAGERPPFIDFEIWGLTTRCIQELGQNIWSAENAPFEFAASLARQLEVNDIGLEDFRAGLRQSVAHARPDGDAAVLYHSALALEDLAKYGDQRYFPGLAEANVEDEATRILADCLGRNGVAI